MTCGPSTDQGHPVGASTSRRGRRERRCSKSGCDGHNRRARPIPADYCIVGKEPRARGSSGAKPSTSRPQQISQVIKKHLTHGTYFPYLGSDIVEKGAGFSKAQEHVTRYRYPFFQGIFYVVGKSIKLS
jgi:hypothetical protein